MPYGMQWERIWSCPLWWGKAPHHDCVFVVEDEDKPGMCGMNVAHIQLFFSFVYKDKEYQCALINWFSRMGQTQDSETGMWKVHPDIQHGQHWCSVIHLDSVLRGAHLLPIFGEKFLPINFDYSDSLHQENVSLVLHTCQAFSILFVTYFYLYVIKEAESWLSNLKVCGKIEIHFPDVDAFAGYYVNHFAPFPWNYLLMVWLVPVTMIMMWVFLWWPVRFTSSRSLWNI